MGSGKTTATRTIAGDDAIIEAAGNVRVKVKRDRKNAGRLRIIVETDSGQIIRIRSARDTKCR